MTLPKIYFPFLNNQQRRVLASQYSRLTKRKAKGLYGENVLAICERMLGGNPSDFTYARTQAYMENVMKVVR